jgi:DNA modification methylase
VTTPPYVHFESENVTLIIGDCIVAMRTLPPNSVHSIVTDPPYGLDFMGNEWDRPNMLGQISQGDTSRGPLPTGPGTNSRGIADHDAAKFQRFSEAWAREALRVLKPGGMLIAFGGDRTYHRLTSGIEDAGFEIRRGMVWIYGQGFAKGLNVSKAIDKGHASARERALEFTAWMRSTGITAASINAATGTSMATHYLTAKSQPEIPTAEQFDLLRPLLPEVPDEIEELVRVRSGDDFPDYAAREVDGVHEKSSAGQIWAAPFRGQEPLPPKERRETASTPEAAAWEGWMSDIKPGFEPIVVARKPLESTVAASVLEHGTGAYNVAGTSHDAERITPNVVLSHAALLDDDGEIVGDACADGCVAGCAVLELEGQTVGASRFFPAFRYQPKATPRERPVIYRQACRCETDVIWRKGVRCPVCNAAAAKVAHPTVKPVALIRWLIRLVTVEGGTVLEPFAGSGSAIAAALAENDKIIAIELGSEYIPLLEQRMRSTVDVAAHELTERLSSGVSSPDHVTEAGRLF